MSAVPTRKRARFSPPEQASLAFLAVAVPACGLWLWAASAASAAARGPVVWGAGPLMLVSCLAVAVAVYFAGVARRSSALVESTAAGADRLEREVARLTEALPAIAGRIRTDPQTVRPPAEPADEGLQRLLYTVVQEIVAAERRTAEAEAARTALEEDAARLAEETLPAVVRRIADRASADTVLAEVPQPGGEALQKLLRVVATEIGTADRRGAAAMAACADAAARIQAQTTSLLARLRELQERYDEQEVFADLLELDHRVSQLGRRADGIAVLSGGRSGRRWTKPIPMESVLRGAMGRIDAYRRIRLHATGTVAVAGHAAEGVMHALAELMDNAASFSPHGTEVHVYVEEEDAGVVVTIEDAGLGMRSRERRRAEGLVSRALDLTALSGTRLGLAVVGRLAGKHGLTVNFRPSARGGIGAVVMIPRRLVVQPRPEPGRRTPAAVPAAPRRAAAPQGPDEPAVLDGPGGPDGYDELNEPDELPTRRRGETLAAAAHPPQESTPPRGRPGGGERFAAFRRTRGKGGGDRAAAPDQG